VLDLGCGYGALGLPVAARHPQATCLLVDRNLIAVECAARNAKLHELTRAQVEPSLGYRDLGPDERFDWILCNVPARIGEAAIDHFMAEGQRRLLPGGALRMVVIRDLSTTLELIATRRAWPLELIATGARHQVFGLLPSTSLPASEDVEGLYVRDRVQLAGLTLERPQDVSEDPGHLAQGLPLLLDLLPRTPGPNALVWRGGYGAVACMLGQRGAAVVAPDPDLLATTFTRRNAHALRLTIETRDAATLGHALGSNDAFSCFVGDLSSQADPASLAAEVERAGRAVVPHGTALWLGLTRQGSAVFEQATRSGAIRANPLGSRGAYTVWSIRSV
jgi:hypothetical protein